MAINFTNSPTVGNTVSAGNVTWTWNGGSWVAGLSQNAITTVSNTAPIGASTTGGTATISLLVSGVTAGTYGSATQEGVFVVDTFGRITSASNVTAQVANSNITGLITPAQTIPSGVSASTYGNATIIPVITVDTYGRITSASNTTISSSGITTGKAIAMAIVFGG
jgi:hypothetical protein